MKKITLLFAAILVGFTATSQEVVDTQDFEDGLDDGWTTVINTGTCDWALATDGPNANSLESQGLIFDDDDACGEGSGAAPSNVSILSPEYDISTVEGDWSLTYDMYFDSIVAGDFFAVEAIVDGGDPAQLALFDSDGGDVAFGNQSFTASIDTAGDASTIQFVFTYGDGDGWAWSAGLDNVVFTRTQVLGVSQETVEGFTFAPNPAQNILNLNSQNDMIDRASIVNILGQTVIETEVKATSSTLDISSLAAGTYILKVAVGDETGSYHIIKQ